MKVKFVSFFNLNELYLIFSQTTIKFDFNFYIYLYLFIVFILDSY